MINEHLENSDQVIIMLMRFYLLLDENEIVLVEDMLQNYLLIPLDSLVLNLDKNQQQGEQLAVLDGERFKERRMVERLLLEGTAVEFRVAGCWLWCRLLKKAGLEWLLE